MLSGAVLDAANLEGANLSGAVLSPCTAPDTCGNTSARGAHLKNANLSSAHLEGVAFDKANFYSSVAPGTNTCDTTRHDCASARNATLTGTGFKGAYLYGTDFSGASMRDVTFDGAVLVGANFDSATVGLLPNTANGSFADAFLQGANLGNADMDGVTFDGAFFDFAPNGNTMLMQLDGGHTAFAGWPTPGQPVCTRITYGAWASVPLNSTIICADGTPDPPGGCGEAASSPPLNPHWDNKRDISTTDPKASYRIAPTYGSAAPDLCERNFAW